MKKNKIYLHAAVCLDEVGDSLIECLSPKEFAQFIFKIIDDNTVPEYFAGIKQELDRRLKFYSKEEIKELKDLAID